MYKDKKDITFNMDGFTELIIDRTDFDKGWCKTYKCGWCGNDIIQTDKPYLEKGNICNPCSSKINQKHMDNIEKEKEKRLEDKKEMLKMFEQQLEHTLGEEERQSIYNHMEKLHNEIKYHEILKELN